MIPTLARIFLHHTENNMYCVHFLNRFYVEIQILTAHTLESLHTETNPCLVIKDKKK